MTPQDTSGYAGTDPHTLTSALDGGEWSASHTRGLAHPKAALETTKKRKISAPP